MNTHAIKTALYSLVLIILTGFAAIGIYKTFFDKTSQTLKEAEQAIYYQIVKFGEIKTVKPGDTFDITTTESVGISPAYLKLWLSYDKNIFKLISNKIIMGKNTDEQGRPIMGRADKRILTFMINKDIFGIPDSDSNTDKIGPAYDYIRGILDHPHSIFLWHLDPELLYMTTDTDTEKGSGKYVIKIPRTHYEVFSVKIVKPEGKK